MISPNRLRHRVRGRHAVLVTAALVGVLAAVSVPAVTIAGTPVRKAATDTDHDGLTDKVETTWGITSPTSNDSDHDGLRDSAEDPDDDGLSNLGEQHFGTSPDVADTDADGILDGDEDADHDGVRNALEQDDRPVPATLLPSLWDAPLDLSANYSNGCHTSAGGVAIHPCVSGDPAGTTRITIFGDSHALAWLPALERLAPWWHWRIVAITKSACPSIDVTFEEPFFTRALPSCLSWRKRGLAWIRTHPQDLVILANSRGYRLTDKDGDRIHSAERELEWQDATARTLQKLPAGRTVLVLGDVPVPKANVPLCLRRHPDSIAACERSRRSSTHNDYDDAERAAAAANGAAFGSMSSMVCPYDPCPVVVDELLLWRDNSHLTKTYARQLAPSLRAIIVAALNDTDQAAGTLIAAAGSVPRIRR